MQDFQRIGLVNKPGLVGSCMLSDRKGNAGLQGGQHIYERSANRRMHIPLGWQLSW